ncbi:MAG: 50S ribosomal protein L31e [archaeon]
MTDKSKKIIIERTYNVPLRKEWLKVARHKRTNKAVKALREFLQKHMKSEDVRLGMYVNEHMWKHGIKNPPHHVKVNVTKDEEGIVRAELEGKEFKEAIKSKPKEEKTSGLKGKLQDALKKTKGDEPEEEKVEEKKVEVKAEEKKTVAKKATPKKKAPAKKKTATSKSSKKTSK